MSLLTPSSFKGALTRFLSPFLHIKTLIFLLLLTFYYLVEQCIIILIFWSPYLFFEPSGHNILQSHLFPNYHVFHPSLFPYTLHKYVFKPFIHFLSLFHFLSVSIFKFYFIFLLFKSSWFFSFIFILVSTIGGRFDRI